MSDVLTDLEAAILTICNVTADSGLQAAYIAPFDKMPDTYPHGELTFNDAQIISEWDANGQLLYERTLIIEVKSKDSAEINNAMQKLAYLFPKQPYRATLAALGCGDIKPDGDATSYEVDDDNAELVGVISFTMKYFTAIS